MQEVRIILGMRKSKRIGILPWLLGFFLLGAAGCFQGCSNGGTETNAPTDPLLRARRERDLAFRSNPQSPIPSADRASFRGLEYFDVDLKLRFQVMLNRLPEPKMIRIATNTGEVRDALRYGFFEFSVQGRTCRLFAYRLDDNLASGKPILFIPFKDATTGKESYGAGRYLDLAENTTGIYELDFNLAYNPSCAYGGDFSCPVPPEENWPSIPIRAGEKNYSVGHARIPGQ
jgi:uncharacterized protein